jgi:hypothetical protein
MTAGRVRAFRSLAGNFGRFPPGLQLSMLSAIREISRDACHGLELGCLASLELKPAWASFQVRNGSAERLLRVS